jgi:C-methyltransferase
MIQPQVGDFRMERPEILSKEAGRSAARVIDEMSRLYYLSRAIHVAAELGIADHLTEAPVALEDIAKETRTDATCLKRLLRFLSAYGIFVEVSRDLFCNTTLSSVFRSDHPNSVRAGLRRIGDFWWSAVGNMEQTIRTGQSAFVHLHGVDFFQYLKGNPDVQKRFDQGMASISDADDAAIAAAYEFGRFSRIIDVGGGQGGLLVQILRQAPAATGILFEQPQVLERATRLREAGLEVRSEMLAGDFFKSVPAGGDCYVIKGVLHDFDDDHCVKILSNCRKSVTSEGLVVIANLDLPSVIDGPHPNLTMDIQMMTLLRGRERTIAEWSDLFQRSGLKLGGTFQTSVGFTIIEGVPV